MSIRRGASVCHDFASRWAPRGARMAGRPPFPRSTAIIYLARVSTRLSVGRVWATGANRPPSRYREPG